MSWTDSTGLISLGLATFWVAMALSGCESDAMPGPAATAARITTGKQLYDVGCAGCHKPTGKGAEGVGLPLAGSAWVEGRESRLVRIALHGVRGPIEVQGRSYNLEMPGFGPVYDDESLAAILTYVRQAWGNQAPPVTTETMREIRAVEASRGDSWTVEELLAVP